MKKKNRLRVLLKNGSCLDVDLYFEDIKLYDPTTARLFIQLNGCVCALDIEESVCRNFSTLEQLIRRQGLSNKENLC